MRSKKLPTIVSGQNNITSADSRHIWQGAAPCGPFRRLTCALRPFSTHYMRPAALSVHISVSICVSVSKSPKRLLNASTKCTKNRKKFTEGYVTIFEEFSS